MTSTLIRLDFILQLCLFPYNMNDPKQLNSNSKNEYFSYFRATKPSICVKIYYLLRFFLIFYKPCRIFIVSLRKNIEIC